MVFVLHNRRLLTKNLTKLGYQLEDMQFSTMVVYIIHLLYDAIQISHIKARLCQTIYDNVVQTLSKYL